MLHENFLSRGEKKLAKVFLCFVNLLHTAWKFQGLLLIISHLSSPYMPMHTICARTHTHTHTLRKSGSSSSSTRWATMMLIGYKIRYLRACWIESVLLSINCLGSHPLIKKKYPWVWFQNRYIPINVWESQIKHWHVYIYYSRNSIYTISSTTLMINVLLLPT